jgi:tRNA(Ile)-lysidine synthetase-like protein
MVIAFVLSHMTNPSSALFLKNCSNITIYAAHVDYANRPESASEAIYVKRFCEQNNIQFHSVRIEQVTRGITDRDEYERISRTVRFQLYKDILPSFSDGGGVMLGHHRGDLRENVLSNACKGCGPLDLSGMSPVGKVEGVPIWRPLLSIEKDVVLDFAHKFGVPYFKDTTPRWSTRGKLRNHLLPLIQDVYGDGCLANLTNLALESEACRKLFFEDEFVQPFFHSVKRYSVSFHFKVIMKEGRSSRLSNFLL